MAIETAEVISIRSAKLRSIVNDSVKSAGIVNLVYVSDKQAGITRIKKGDKFIYKAGDKIVKDDTVLQRIKSLVIPPAWQQVWICTEPNGHLQATGIDTLGRKQYRYHPLWSALRSETKFSHLYDFGCSLCEIRESIRRDLALPGLPLRKVLAAVVSLMEYTGIRIGGSSYEKLYGTFGVTTLKDRHVKINGSEMKFSFKGKKGVYQDITFKSRKLAAIIKQCRDIPGKELFQYYDDNGARKSVDSGMVNDYIKNLCKGNFTAKDFRTWVGTLCALQAFRQLGHCATATETKKKIVEALDITAKRLGNTRSVCRKYYVHPIVVEHYTNGTIEKYTRTITVTETTTITDAGLSAEEQALLKMLKKASNISIQLPAA